MIHFTCTASCVASLEDGADGIAHICEGNLSIFIIVQHVKGLGCMLGIHEVLNVFDYNVGPASNLTWVLLQSMTIDSRC